ncbi:MAG: SDR family oxidoreductase [Candidatus Eremiobacteraeota bacterium]|nr:SDR family oxidoreductase [Candidatus Eremiobacteraeota bacterium]
MNTVRHASLWLDLRLDGDTIVLAGATGRAGGATLHTLVGRGAFVILVSRSRLRAEELIATLPDSEAQRRCHVIEADLADAAAGERVATSAIAWRGRVDAVVSLAGGGSAFVAIADSSFDDLQTSIRNNLDVTYNLFVPLLRRIVKQPARENARSRCRFVAVTAGSSLTPQPRFGIMGAGKAGVNLLMRAIAREHKADGVVANAVILGTVATEPARDYLDEAEFDAAASPQEVADLLAFHASDASSCVNGELIHLNAREVD